MSGQQATPADFIRRDGRRPGELRPIHLERGFVQTAAGSVLARSGGTVILCTASVENSLPPWMKDQTRGWLTAEYNMLPGSTRPRKPRERAGKVDGRTTEIQRLIGRSLRSILDLQALGPRQITLDCDVLQADGGTRVLSITASFVALVDALASMSLLHDPATGRPALKSSIAAISLGWVAGRLLLDLDYSEDHVADVDANIVMTGAEECVEIQATAENATYSRNQLNQMLDLATDGLRQLRQIQRAALGPQWPFADA
jgi:ribonuclease PH